jgi:HK97 family phage portal protein
VLRKPNHFQNRIQFIESWVTSKYEFGNTYVLKQRDNRNVVVALYVLDPSRVTPLVAPNGDVYYELRRDELAGLEDDTNVVVPATALIHDRFNCFFHPLVGLSPIFANGLAAIGGLAIERSSADFFANGSRVPGILTAPGAISQETAERLKSSWEDNYTGNNAGKVAVLGDGLKFEAMAVKATDAQLIEQLKWSAETVCSTYHVPPYKIGIGNMPTYNNIQALNTEYYSQCLQVQIEQMELCLDEGLGLADNLGVEFDIDNLLRMDSQTQITALKDGTGAGLFKPNEGRKKLNLPPVEGGDTPYLQVQNYSLAALNKRDNGDAPFAPSAPAASPPANDDNVAAEAERALSTIIGGLQ